ncbi:CHAT domain-containing protein [Fulvivirgaceae bacterium BMA10]|uniref:CHAT domain-containing protein n=1 Tax=Splendidivirga corallicola TaxID=3051826 RepID=A0ABT8KK83_9BACT|nr:CHAT domain-containing protein [Fulvivirgaceae bacterium BMA10]
MNKFSGFLHVIMTHAFLMLMITTGFAQNDISLTDTLLANQYFERGRSLMGNANYDSAIFYFQKASPIYQYNKLWLKEINCLDYIADTYRQAGKFDEALKVGNEALEMVHEKIGKGNLKEAEVLNTVGIIYDYKGDYEKALDYQLESIRIKEELLGANHTDLADSYNNAGIVYYYMGDYEQALNCYGRVVEIQQKALKKDPISLASTYNNIGMIHTMNGDYTMALQYIEKSLGMKLENLGEHHPDVASPYNSIGVVYYYKKDFEQALYYQNKVLEIKKEHFEEDHPFMVLSYNNLGLIYGNIGKPALALDYFQKSLSIQKKTLGEKHSDIAITHRFIGEIHLNSGNYIQALEAYQKALMLRKQIFGEKHPEVTESYNDLAQVYLLLKGDPEQVLKLSQKALIANVIDFQDSSYYNNPSLKNYYKQNFLLTSLRLKAEAFEHKFHVTGNVDNLQNSLATFNYCDELIDQISKDRLQHDDKIAFGNISAHIYERAVDVSTALYHQHLEKDFLHKAYYFSEKSKAGVLRQTLSGYSAKNFGLVPDDLLAFEKQLKVNRAYYQTKIRNHKSRTQGNDSPQLKTLENKLFDLNRTYDSLVSAYEKNYPEYHQLKYQNDIIDIQRIPKILTGQNSALVEYFLSDSTLHIFTITPDNYHISTVPLIQNFDSLVQTLRENISYRNPSEANEELNFVSIAHQLYLHLFAPVKAHLTDEIERITIVPHGVLSLIPFELLISAELDNQVINYRELPYLLKDYQISYAYSGTLWAKKYHEKSEWEQQFAGYAPTYQTSLLADSRALEEYGSFRDEITNLKYTNEEIRNAATFFKGATFSGENATEALFKKEGGKYQILHLAMHAIVDKENPLQSKLIFTQNEDSLEDGFLNAYELYNMELNAELAVLSACNTGYGKVAKGEGVMSLGRAFAYAGCPSIVMSLWPAQDRATADIMTYFYDGLSQGEPKDIALHNAKLKYLQNTEDLFVHPFYWAGFVIQGDPRPIEMHSKFRYWWVFGLVAGLVLLGLWQFRLKTLSRKHP